LRRWILGDLEKAAFVIIVLMGRLYCFPDGKQHLSAVLKVIKPMPT
jgi:hypothetical protein